MGAMHLPCFFVGICWCLENRMPFEPVRSGEQKRPETVRCVSSHLSLLWDFTWIVHPLYPWQNTYVGTLRHSAFQKGTSPPGLRSWTKCGRGEEVLLGNGRCLHHWGRSWSGTRCPESHGTECFCPRPETNRCRGWEGWYCIATSRCLYRYDPNNWQRPVPSCCFFGTLVWIVMINFRQMWEIMPHCYGFFSAKKKTLPFQHLGRWKSRLDFLVPKITSCLEAVPALESLTSQKKPYVQTLPPRNSTTVVWERFFEGLDHCMFLSSFLVGSGGEEPADIITSWKVTYDCWEHSPCLIGDTCFIHACFSIVIR